MTSGGRGGGAFLVSFNVPIHSVLFGSLLKDKRRFNIHTLRTLFIGSIYIP